MGLECNSFYTDKHDESFCIYLYIGTLLKYLYMDVV